MATLLLYLTRPKRSRTSAALLTTGLIQHLDANYEASYNGSGSQWTDMSGNGNHGTIPSSGAVFTTLDGFKYFEMSNKAISAPLAKSNSMTFSAWGRNNSMSADMLFNAGPNRQGTDLFFVNNQYVSWNTWDSGRNRIGPSGIPISWKTGWHAYTIVVNQTDNNVKMYVDGAFYGSALRYVAPTRSNEL